MGNAAECEQDRVAPVGVNPAGVEAVEVAHRLRIELTRRAAAIRLSMEALAMTSKPRSRIFIVAVVSAVVMLAPFLASRAVGFTYSSGERIGFVERVSSEGTVCDTYEGTLMMGIAPGGPATPWRFSVRDKRVANEIAGLKGQRVALHYRQEKGGQLVCFRKTEYVATGVRRID